VSSRTSSELSALTFSEPVLSGKSLKGPFLAWNFSSAVGFFFLSASSSLPALSVSSLMNMNRFSSTSSHGSFSSCALSFFLSLKIFICVLPLHFQNKKIQRDWKACYLMSQYFLP